MPQMILVSTVKRQFQFQFGKMMDPRKFEFFSKCKKKSRNSSYLQSSRLHLIKVLSWNVNMGI